MIKQIIKSRGNVLNCLSGILRMIGCTTSVSYLNTCFISTHKPATTIYFPCVFFFFPFSVVLAAQNVSASLVTDDRFKTAQNGVTDPPYSLTCLEQGKTPRHSHISAENLLCWGEANCRLISNYTNCTVFWAQYNEFFLSFLQTWIKYLVLNGKVKNKRGFVSRQWINMSCSLNGKGGAGIFTLIFWGGKICLWLWALSTSCGYIKV